MSNLDVYLPAIDGSQYWLHEKGESCKNAVHTLFSDDYAAPPLRMVIEITTDTGRVVTVSIPYDHNGKASVQIDGESV
ncbi:MULTISPECIES: hypothetical protein [unclassified Pseudomonas]|uniref:hypothetical protein n=2 Tax=Pseudomonas TaxID=286 RepID=UPI002B235B0B|nr:MULTISPECIES: hypothetical protein [unclassified Pseudomonas]MEA9994325.1 hypothetical protein [Pseudomonas sp. AA4]MEB0088801.1 hypothetical protein [Pseudomonas sp. RTI1]MEB0126579.1 hypothetical protein [Pseudomonas sp. CCC1.2]MEB0154021.1 hypothetical protein [Pseudomonas sp. CCC4.3]MEB0220789.1 hypothetical protein [Pseudomonas sp. AB12(2023)]